MKPTIETIIERYKNTKKVRCANSKSTGKVDFSDLEITPNGDIVQNPFKKNWIVLYFSKKDRYAEIISYKEETVPVPLRLIKELCKEKNIEEILIREGIIEDTRYVKIPLSEIKNNPNDMLLGKLVRNIADNY